MEINYRLSEQDYIDFNLFHLKTSKTMKNSIFLQRIIGPILFFIGIFVGNRITQVPIFYYSIIFFVMGVLWYVFYPKRIEKRVKSKILKMLSEGENKAMLGNQTVLTGEAEIIFSNDFETTKVRWKTFYKIEKTEKHIFLYNSAISAYIIPTAAFINFEEAELFFSDLSKKIENERVYNV